MHDFIQFLQQHDEVGTILIIILQSRQVVKCLRLQSIMENWDEYAMSNRGLGAPDNHAVLPQGGDGGGALSVFGLPECVHAYSAHTNG